MTSLLFVFSIHKMVKYKLSLYCNILTIESLSTHNTPCTLHILYSLSEIAMEIVPHWIIQTCGTFTSCVYSIYFSFFFLILVSLLADFSFIVSESDERLIWLFFKVSMMKWLFERDFSLFLWVQVNFGETWGTEIKGIGNIWWSECFLHLQFYDLSLAQIQRSNDTDWLPDLGVWNFPGNQSPKYRCIWSQHVQTILGLWVKYRSTCHQNLF